MDTLQFYVELIDRISGPAQRASRALASLEARLRRIDALTASGRADRLGGQLDRVARGAHRTSTQASGAGAGFGGLLQGMSAAANVAGAFLSVLQQIGGALYSAGRAAGEFLIDQAMFQQGTLTTLNTLLREQGPGAGRREFNRSLQLAALLPGDNNEFVAMRRQLASGGFTDNRERDVVFAMIQDIAQMNPQDRDVGNRLSTVLSQIRGADRVNGGDMLQLQNAGVFRTDVFDALARGRNMHGSTRDLRRRVQGLVSHGQIGGDEFIRAVAESVTHRTGGPLGQFALAQGNSLAGLVSNLQSAPATLLQNLDLANLPGLQAFTGFLREMNGLLDATTPRGQRVMQIFEQLINGVFGSLVQRGDATRVFDAILEVAEQLVPVIVSLAKGLRTFLGPAFQIVAAAMGPLFASLGNSGNAAWFQALIVRTAQALGVLGAVMGWLIGLVALGLVVVIGGLTEALVQLWRGLLWLSEAFAGVGRAVSQFFSTLWTSTTTFFRTLDLTALGARMIEGLGLGIRRGAVAAWSAVRDVGQGIVSRFTGFFEISSPSRRMMRLGNFVSLGFALGIERGADRSGLALADLVQTPTVSRAGTAPAREASALNVDSIALHVHVGEHSGSADDIAREVSRILPSALLRAFDQLALERGVPTP